MASAAVRHSHVSVQPARVSLALCRWSYNSVIDFPLRGQYQVCMLLLPCRASVLHQYPHQAPARHLGTHNMLHLPANHTSVLLLGAKADGGGQKGACPAFLRHADDLQEPLPLWLLYASMASVMPAWGAASYVAGPAPLYCCAALRSRG